MTHKIKIKILFILGILSRRFLSYKYDPNRYKGSFLTNNPKREKNECGKPAKKIIYAFWTGDNEITPNRQRCLKISKVRAGVDIVLVTPKDLNNYILEESPLHPAYPFLSLNHRSDYLRCYFMHHHGGGYMDVKEVYYSWSDVFDKLNKREDKWIAGYHELAPSTTPDLEGNVGVDIKRNYFRLIGNGGFIAKPYTPLTHEWFSELNRFLDVNFEQLKKHPGNMWGTNPGYPLPWASVQACIFHPLVLKYHERVIQDRRLMMSFENYK